MAVNLNTANDQMTSMVAAREDQLTQQLANANPDDMRSMLELQHSMQKWTLATNMQSNTMKTLADGIKSTIQNLR